MTPEEICIEGIKKSKGEFAIVYAGVNEDEMIRFMKEPWVMVGSDGVPGAFHPRTHGTLPRFLGRYARDKGVLSLEEAVRKATSLPAETFGFKKRGKIEKGYYADIVVFDADKIIDAANLLNPREYPKGIEYVFVNGTIVVEEGKRNDNMPGKVLLRS
jgi:N-acyl-D-amino-acid deacylase